MMTTYSLSMAKFHSMTSWMSKSCLYTPSLTLRNSRRYLSKSKRASDSLWLPLMSLRLPLLSLASDMWLTVAGLKRSYSTRDSRFLNSKFSGSPKHLLSRGLEEPVELGRVTATGCTQLPYSPNYRSTAILK
jgi:hypothetical protein